MEEELQNQLKSWPLWLAIAALVVFVGKTFFNVEIDDTVNGLMNLLLTILIAFGVVMIQQTKKGYKSIHPDFNGRGFLFQ